MKVMIVGGDGRAHTLAWKIVQSPKVEKVFCAPGNGGTAQIAENLPIAPTDINGQVKAVQEKKVDLVVVSPEGPLDLGIVDRLQEVGIPAFGTTTAATRLESSKVFARKIMEKYGIPCPSGKTFYDYDYLKAREYLKKHSLPIVVKADGLAAGKGVVIAQNREEAQEALHNFMIRRTLGDAGNSVIIDKFVSGREVSLMAFTDGYIVKPMVSACDYKKIFDGDQGPNTGGMGSYSPSEFLNEMLVGEIAKITLIPAVRAMAEEGRFYQGVLYGGLVINGDGKVLVFEYNARFGDPETQVQIPRLKTDLIDIMRAVINGTLSQTKIEWSDNACVGVVMASAGYPGEPKTGFPITGLDAVDKDILVFHAGTKMKDGQLVTSGGRVLTVVATGKTLAEAREKVYDNVPRIHFEGCQYREDIALIR